MASLMGCANIVAYFQAIYNTFLARFNVDSIYRKNYKKVIAEMPPEELEHWYDETYQMCLLAFMRLEQNNRKKEFDVIKKRLEEKE